jgi:hypothetical protein
MVKKLKMLGQPSEISLDAKIESRVESGSPANEKPPQKIVGKFRKLSKTCKILQPRPSTVIIVTLV